MTRSFSGLSWQRGLAVLAAASLAVFFAGTARASDDAGTPSAERTPQSAGANAPVACHSACVAQQALETALHTPIRLGSGRFELRVASTKLTIGWSLAF
jgi:hypothetical protein